MRLKHITKNYYWLKTFLFLLYFHINSGCDIRTGLVPFKNDSFGGMPSVFTYRTRIVLLNLTPYRPCDRNVLLIDREISFDRPDVFVGFGRFTRVISGLSIAVYNYLL